MSHTRPAPTVASGPVAAAGPPGGVAVVTAPGDKINIIIVDDHPLVHQGIAAITGLHDDLHLLGSATTVGEGLELLAQQPHVALVDLRLARESGLTLVEKGRAVAAHCRFIIMTSALD